LSPPRMRFSYVLHCLPGPQPHKAVAIRNVADVLGPAAYCSVAPSWGAPNDIHHKRVRSSAPSTGKAGVHPSHTAERSV
jgi:hypothetical protein